VIRWTRTGFTVSLCSAIKNCTDSRENKLGLFCSFLPVSNEQGKENDDDCNYFFDLQLNNINWEDYNY